MSKEIMTGYTYEFSDTIAAIATPPGEGGVAIIRICGPNATHVADKIFSGNVHKYEDRKVYYGNVINEKGGIIDDAILLIMRGKRSYPGEDTVEIQCHGGSLVSKQVLEAAIKAGARAAQPGEFTFRSFINGKIDLSQAEAVQTLIAAKSESALKSAQKQLQGDLSQKIIYFQEKIVDIAAMLEAWVDFPEEEIEFAPIDEVLSSLKQTCDEMKFLENTFYHGKMLNDGISLCIVGTPNVGKSSLMNALLGKDRAIVTEIPGTTRDILEDDLSLNGLHFRIIDTAGIRLTSDLVEKEGIKRSKQAIEEADIILFILDVQCGFEREESLRIPEDKTIAVWNKIDLPYDPLPKLPFKKIAHISAKENLGLEDLIKCIDQSLEMKCKESLLITNARHKEALSSAIKACENVIEGLQKTISPELLALDIRLCLNELGKIIGIDVTEDILSSIFSKFCVGK